MRTTLDIADDVLLIAKAQSSHAKQPLGRVISDLARKGLQAAEGPGHGSTPDTAAKLARLGIQVLPLRGQGLVTNEMVNRIRDEEGI